MRLREGAWLLLLLPLSAAGESPETLLTCRKIESATERLACYDRVVDRATTELTPEAAPLPPRASSSPAGATAEAESDRAALRERGFGRSTEREDRVLREAYGAEEPPSEITADVVGVRRTGDQTVEFTLRNGQVWRQREAEAFALRAGDRVVIETGVFGGYYARRDGGGRRTSVKRVR
jgi:hypothetical protein